MAIMLPSEVSYLLNMVGFEWPEGNEDKIFEWASDWMAYASEVDGSTRQVDNAAGHALQHNMGKAMDAFSADLSRGDGIAEVAHKLGTAGNVLGGCLIVVAAAVIALKIAFVVNLVALAIQIAEAVAAAVATFGASLAWIPIAREIARRLIELAINLALNALMGG